MWRFLREKDCSAWEKWTGMGRDILDSVVSTVTGIVWSFTSVFSFEDRAAREEVNNKNRRRLDREFAGKIYHIIYLLVLLYLFVYSEAQILVFFFLTISHADTWNRKTVIIVYTSLVTSNLKSCSETQFTGFKVVTLVFQCSSIPHEKSAILIILFERFSVSLELSYYFHSRVLCGTTPLDGCWNKPQQRRGCNVVSIESFTTVMDVSREKKQNKPI